MYGTWLHFARSVPRCTGVGTECKPDNWPITWTLNPLVSRPLCLCSHQTKPTRTILSANLKPLLHVPQAVTFQYWGYTVNWSALATAMVTPWTVCVLLRKQSSLFCFNYVMKHSVNSARQEIPQILWNLKDQLLQDLVTWTDAEKDKGPEVLSNNPSNYADLC
jgi:hypothetical protein